MSDSIFEITVWTFEKDGDSHSLTAIYPITESEARISIKKKGFDSEGWTAHCGAQFVTVTAPGPEEDGNLHRFTVTLTRTQECEVEVEARSEKEARCLALDLDIDEWECDGYMDVDNIVDEGPVEEEK